MIPGRYSLEIYRNDTTRWNFQLFEDEAGTVPMDLTGATVKAEIRDVSMQKASYGPFPYCATGNPLIAELDLTIELPNIVHAMVGAIPNYQYGTRAAWDLQITWPSGDIQTVLAGNVSISGDVTQ